MSLRSLAAPGTVTPARRPLRHVALRRTAAAARTHPARRAAVDVAVGAVPTARAERLLRAAARVTRPEAIRTSTRLANRELGNRTRRRRLPFGPRQRCTD